jgi:CheY-like chemotaxis protein
VSAPELAPVALDALLRDTVDAFRDRLVGGAVRLTLDLPERPAPLLTDGAKLREVLVHLIGNAVKFTPAGSVTVRLFVQPVSRRPLRVDVVDTGIGIAPERHAEIFGGGEPGLGLPLSRARCAELGFRLALSSALGGGAMFSIVLEPDGELALEPLPAAPLPPRAAPRSRGLALLIDADRSARLLVARVVEQLGFEVVMTASGPQGVAMACELRPRFVALDLMVPDLAGLEVLAQLRAAPELAGTPVVLVSAVAREYAQGLPGVDALQKPVDAAELGRVLDRYFTTPASPAPA